MAELRSEPQSANEYDDRTTAAVKSVLLEIGQILGSFQGKFAVIGGAVPWLLLDNEEMPHVGTLDVDLGLDAEALGDGEYARLVETLMKHDYRQREDLRRFQLIRQIPATDGGDPGKLISDWESTNRALRTWIESKHLETIVLEISNATGTSLIGRWDIEIAYGWEGGDGSSFWVDRGDPRERHTSRPESLRTS